MDSDAAQSGQTAVEASITSEQQVIDALQVLAERFETAEHDGPTAYANFLVSGDDADEHAQLRNEAVFAVREFLAQLSAG